MPTIRETMTKMGKFSGLLDGWHFGEGQSATLQTANSAQALLTKAEEFDYHEADVFPGVNGEIQIAIYHAENDYEFTIETNGTITFAHDRDGEELSYEEGLSLEQAIEQLAQLSGRTWLSSDLFTSITTTGLDADSVAWLSGTPVMAQAYQLSIADVLNIPAGQSVSISPDFIILSSGNQAFIGQCLTMPFLPDVTSSRETANLEIGAITISKTGQMRMLDGNLRRCA